MTLKEVFDQLSKKYNGFAIRVGCTFDSTYSEMEKETGCWHITVGDKFFCTPQDGHTLAEVFEEVLKKFSSVEERRTALQAEIDLATRKLRELEAA